MRALVLSDLHIEHAPYQRPNGEFDLVILAGDIHNGVQSLIWARHTFPDDRIVQIAGNHEFYDQVLQPCRDAMVTTARSLAIDYLDDASVLIDDVEFFGTTLWTDFRYFEANSDPSAVLSQQQAMQANLGLIADYFAIKVAHLNNELPALRRFAPADSVLLHETSKRWLASALAQSKASKRVVISHHLPSARSVSARFASALTNAAFVSNLDDMVAQAHWWIHGHTHSSHRYALGKTTVLANPRGYPSRRNPGLFENRQFESDLIVDFSATAQPPTATVGAETS